MGTDQKKAAPQTKLLIPSAKETSLVFDFLFPKRRRASSNFIMRRIEIC